MSATAQIESAASYRAVLTLFTNEAATDKTERICTLSELAQMVLTTDASAKQELPWLKCARFGDRKTAKGCLRNNKNMLAITGVEADYDAERISFDEARDRAADCGILCLIYTSPSHTEDRPRWRIICPFSREYSPDKRARFLARLNGVFGGVFSNESWTLSQSYYFGSVNHNPSHRAKVLAGTPIDLLDVLDAGAIGKPPRPPPGAGVKSSPDQLERRYRGYVEKLLDNVRSAPEGQKHFTLLHNARALGGIMDEAGIVELEAIALLINAQPRSVKDWEKARLTAEDGLRDGRVHPITLEERPRPNGNGAAGSPTHPIDPSPPPSEEPQPSPEDDTPTFFDPWAEVKPPDWPERVLSPAAEQTLAAISLRDGVDYGALCLAYIASASGAAPKNVRFKPFDDTAWTVPPVLWIMLIQDSGQRKTEIINTGFHELKRINSTLWAEHMQRLREWRNNGDERGKKPDEPRSYIVNDTTLEKLQLILAEQPYGTMLLRDELAAIFDFGRYQQNGKGAAERAFYLEAYEGGSHSVHRLGRDSIFMQNTAVSIFGGIQPTRLADFKGLENDGLLQRICTVLAKLAQLSRRGIIVPDQQISLHEPIARLAQFTGAFLEKPYTTTAEGSQLIRDTEREGHDFALITDYGPGFQGWCAKMHGTVARAALILHLLDKQHDQCIPAETIDRAHRLVRTYLLKHTLAFYDAIPGSNRTRLQDIGGWLLTKAKPRVLTSDLKAGVKSCRDMSLRELSQALDPFVTGGWLEPEEDYPSNRAWSLHPGLREAFTKRTAAERQRRAEIRARIGRATDAS